MSSIAVRNPADHSIGEVPRESFHAHWKYLGWEEVPEDEVRVLGIVNSVSGAPVGMLDDLKRDDLRAAAERARIPVKGNASKSDIIAQIRAAAASGDVDPATANTDPPHDPPDGTQGQEG